MHGSSAVCGSVRPAHWLTPPSRSSSGPSSVKGRFGGPSRRPSFRTRSSASSGCRRSRPSSLACVGRGDGGDGVGSDDTDAVLVDAVGRGDETALGRIYDRHATPMLRLAERLLGDPSLAEDVIQETFVRLWQQPGNFDARRGSLRSYLLAMVYGRSIDRLRSDGSRRRRERADAADPGDGDADGDAVHDEVWRTVVVGEVRAALRVLTPGEAEAILLAYFGGFSYQQVAVLLGQPEGTTKARIRSGLHRMRRHLVLSLDGDEPPVIDLRGAPASASTVQAD